MVIIDTIYQLTERDTSKVNGLWKGLQVLGYAIAAITGLICTISFYNLLHGFSMNCLLYADIVFKELTPANPKYDVLSNVTNVTIDMVMTTWNKDFSCQYCIHVWMMSFVGGTILGIFFILNPKGGKGYAHSIFSQPWKMINPMIVISLLMVILTGVATVNAAGGINAFCAEFRNYTGTARCTKQIDIHTLKFHMKPEPFNKTQKYIKACSVLTCFAWSYCVVLLMIRVCLAPDFHLQKITIIPKERKHVELQERKILSKTSDSVLPRFPLGKIEELPVIHATTDGNDENQTTQLPENDGNNRETQEDGQEGEQLPESSTMESLKRGLFKML